MMTKTKLQDQLVYFSESAAAELKYLQACVTVKRKETRLSRMNYFIKNIPQRIPSSTRHFKHTFLATWKAKRACKSKKCQPSYLFLVPHHGIFHFGSHLHVPSPGLGHLSLKTHSERDTEGGHGVSDGVTRRAEGGPRPLYLVGRCVMKAGGKTREQINRHTHGDAG